MSSSIKSDVCLKLSVECCWSKSVRSCDLFAADVHVVSLGLLNGTFETDGKKGMQSSYWKSGLVQEDVAINDETSFS